MHSTECRDFDFNAPTSVSLPVSTRTHVGIWRSFALPSHSDGERKGSGEWTEKRGRVEAEALAHAVKKLYFADQQFSFWPTVSILVAIIVLLHSSSSCTLSSNLFVRVFAQDPFKGFRHRTPRQGDQQDGALQLADGGFQLQDKAVIVNRCPCPWGQISNRYPCYCMPSAGFGPCPCDSSLDYSIKKWDTHSLRFSRNWTVSLLETLVFLKCNRTATFKWYKIIVLWVWINSY